MSKYALIHTHTPMDDISKNLLQDYLKVCPPPVKDAVRILIKLKYFFGCVSLREAYLIVQHLYNSMPFSELGLPENRIDDNPDPISRQAIQKVYSRGLDILLENVIRYSQYDQILRGKVSDYPPLYLGLAEELNKRLEEEPTLHPIERV